MRRPRFAGGGPPARVGWLGGLLGTALSAAAAANPLPQPRALSVEQVRLVLGQAVTEAQRRGRPATIAVTDRVGNVLAVYAMNGAPSDVTISAGRRVVDPKGLADLTLTGGARAAAIAKAITAAYLSSNGNAFSSRTASLIVQENFFPGSEGLEGGPLFGVQFSQLPCSDLSVRFASDAGGRIDPRIGPKRSPLGFSADPGGMPLYVEGVLAGGIGVVADGVYGLDRNVRDRDRDLDESIAVAGSVGFAAPRNLRADRITVDGRSLRYADAGDGRRNVPADLAAAGAFVPVAGYFAGAPRAGEAFGFAGSGIQPDPDDRFGSPRAYVLTTAGGANRYPPIGGTDGGTALNPLEVREILRQTLGVALAARAQIRRPLDSHVEVTISVVDTNGVILGIVRTPDAPVFGTDVSLQKARSAMFFSSAAAPADLAAAGQSAYVTAVQRFLSANALGGAVAYSNRAIGNLARPFYPDGVQGRRNGPLSLPIRSWSPFNTGLQLDLVAGNLVRHLGFVRGLNADTPPVCAGLPRLANGLQIFAGGVPIYRNFRLVGGVGVSGDGIDQDDMVAFLGLDRAGRRLGSGVGNAPRSLRADRLAPFGANLRYVSCPFKPFLGSDRQNVCQGL